MKTTTYVVALLVLIFSASNSPASELAQDHEEVDATFQGSTAQTFGDSAAPVGLDPIYWDFITCTHDAHECYDEASYHGFAHYKAVHDTHLCPGHMHYACYGGHHKK